jgi:glutamine cyclotransferase
MRASFARLIAAGFAAALMSGSAWAQTCAAPKTMTFEVQSQVRRDILGFTQGLEVRGDKLFESTGLIAGTTRLTILKDQIFQLSWQEHQAFVYDLTGKPVRTMRNPQEGWGLTNDGTNLIFTDGGDRLYYVNPADFKVLRSVPVKVGSMPLPALNELEMVDGKIYSNVFLTWDIVRIEPRTGCVEAIAQMNALWDRMSLEERRHIQSDSNFVLNGIAYDPAQKLFYITGKNWMSIYAGRFVDQR